MTNKQICIAICGSEAVACLGFPAPGDKVSLGAPTQPVPGSTDVKSELGIKGLRKLTRDPHIVVSRPV